MNEVVKAQLAALGQTAALLEAANVEYWLFGGWAVDFHAGFVTRPHDDVDVAVWLDDLQRISELLEREGWEHAPETDEDGGTGYERDGVRLELTYLVRADDGTVHTPLRAGSAPWRAGTFGPDVIELHRTRARVVALGPLTDGKASTRDDPGDGVKDRADHETLSRLGGGRRR